ncbi:hypothetical protein J3Q64DRAFT_1752643 [Phycomyces blakesleeanus]|uniref:FAD/NAD(P)-binding domain-containing protein n=2 Tax=Phycomyces blakesleeanus TaxID=4837 RepID=A0A163AEM1_PHYB8|nr:hypothetical protein PHYBLDRAFT_181688 [Phycomyces blakesleeanus NRRL 1555(-)]OAD72941.1 hypothetical protein PHYBLDRAFT_181688 [Phycomyces blakesleeanus NRRL 1555(-)]|eukprot:XP_018290981.1 hypothetical protein PHYBLDRAFT_181688 [Phycomyces blakesleeanus NRRL 1555(-)]
MAQLPKISRVAIIGAGPGGLAAAKALRDENAFENITVFERNNQVGGTWIYSPNVNASPAIPSVNALEVDPPGQQKNDHVQGSAIYSHLNTNLPTPVMGYRDFPFPKNTPLFPSHEHVLKYIQSFADKNQLKPMIRFSTSVVQAEYLQEQKVWRLSLSEQSQGSSLRKEYTEYFDALVVANGHYSVPYIPDIEGLKEVAASSIKNNIKIQHSRDYREPNEFKDKTILVIGGGPSALDIVRESSATAKKIYHAVRTENKLSARALENQAPNCHRVTPPKRFIAETGGRSKVECVDGKLLEDIDVVVFATGYLYSFPFLPFEKNNLIIDGQKVLHLYRFLFYIPNPTLAFIGLPIKVVPLPLSQSQAVVIARVWSGKARLPSEEQMREDDRERQESNNRKDIVLSQEEELSYADHLGAWAEGWEGGDDLSGWSSANVVTGPLSQDWKQMRKTWVDLRKEHLGY